MTKQLIQHKSISKKETQLEIFGPVKLRAFRAIDDPETCQKFYDGHINVLKSYGIDPISSAKNGWFTNPSVYGIIAEKDGVVLGGLKIHKVGGTQPLPIEESIGYMDNGIYKFVENLSEYGAAEGCGLWNSREMAGMGLSMELSRAMVALSYHIGVSRLFLLASDHTIKMTRTLGFRVVRTLGNEGDFNYPTPKYTARVVLGHTDNFSWATTYNRAVMLSLRNQPMQKRKKMGVKSNLEINYQLKI